MSLSSAPIRASLQAVRGCMLRRSCATGGGKWGIGERLKMSAANMLVERFTKSSGFDSAFQGLKIVRLGDGEVTAEMPVTQAITNLSGNLHGGASATLVDILGWVFLVPVYGCQSAEALERGAGADFDLESVALPSLCRHHGAADQGRHPPWRHGGSQRKLSFCGQDGIDSASRGARPQARPLACVHRD
eukprot:m.163671 g.163671  ORF g.163671 m.163671 type:complete len:189 (-) comp10307_c0_seq25:4836-5402(-)